MATRARPISSLDVAIAAGLFAVGVYEVLGDPLGDDVVEGPTALNLGTVALATLPLAWRRSLPFVAAVVVFAAVAARALAADPLETYPTVLAMLIATYSVAGYGSQRDAIVAALVGALAIAIAVVQGSGGDATPDPLASAILFGSVWVIGRVAHVRGERAAETERQARELDRAREAEAAAAAAAERERLAKELHDAVSHSLASIVMQAGGAQDVLDADPARARHSLLAIERAAREGLSEMRRLLAITGRNGEGEALAPQPGLDRLEALLCNAREAGLEVDAIVDGDPRRLPPAIELSAYRMIQEALTNVMKHAGPCRVRVAVRYEPSALAFEVSDEGRGSAHTQSAAPGRGLTGMRERAAVLGGTLEAGPRPDGVGFTVTGRLPLERAE